MTLEDLAGGTARWFDGSGFQSHVVVSSRIRLARNLQAVSFPGRSNEAEQLRVVETVLSACQQHSFSADATFFDASRLSALHRQLLVERHLASPALAGGKGPRGVLVDAEEVLSVMINEEDHLRIQVILPGFQPHRAWSLAQGLDRALQENPGYAYSEKWGYLTACPTNTGTGLRVSALIHLPGLVLTQEMERVVRGIAQMGCVVRGLFGEGTEVAGNLFQVSNQVTLGLSEPDILGTLETVTSQLVEYEGNARETLLRSIRPQIEDKIWRAYGILRRARLLTSQEFMNLVSAVRLGIGLGLLSTPDAGALNAMMVQARPSHIQCLAGRKLDAQERDRHRAEMARRRMAKFGEP